MNISKRLVVSLFIILACVFVGLIFWPFIMDEILKPLSLVAWLLLRIFVLSIGQVFYWGALVLIFILFIFRLIPNGQVESEPVDNNTQNEMLKNIERWRYLYIPNESSTHTDRFREREYIRMLSQMVSTKLHVPVDYHLYESLRQGTIPVPEDIRAYLFDEEIEDKPSILKRFFRAIREFPDRLTGRRADRIRIDHNRMSNDVLCFFETSLEMNQDDENDQSNDD